MNKLVLVLFWAFAGNLFSADCVKLPSLFVAEIVRDEMGDKKINQKLYRHNDKLRSEISIDGISSVTILDFKAGKVIGLLDDTKQYIIFPFNGFPKNPNHVNVEAIFDQNGQCVKMATENLEGIDVEKVKVLSPLFGNVICWVNKSTGLPIKFSNESETRFATFSNLKTELEFIGKFDLPSGYTEKSLPNLN